MGNANVLNQLASATALNQVLYNAGETFFALWKLTRAMLAAGYQYRCSGNGQSSGVKDTSSNLAADQWGVGGLTHGTSAGRGTSSGSVVIGAASPSTGLSTITGVSGFTSASVGDYVVITGSSSTGGPNGPSGNNNGNYRIISQTGTSVTVYAPGMVAESGNTNLAVQEQLTGSNGQITTYTTVTSPGKSTLVNFIDTVFNGFSAADVGRWITILNSASGNNGTYLIVQFVSTSNVLLYSPPNASDNAPFITANDAQNPTLQWVCIDPLTQVYPTYLSGSNGSGAWIDLQGSDILKIPIGANVQTLNGLQGLIRGENVIQKNTGAQGELLGYVPDSAGGTGYLVVAPRVYGNGTGVYGWNISSTDTVTGSYSGATVTTVASPVPIHYISEHLFWHNNATTGHYAYQRIDQNSSTESATTSTTGRFSTLATSSTVTSQLAPAFSNNSNPTTNGFPTVGSYVPFGTAASSGVSTGACQWSVQTPTNPGRAHLMVAACWNGPGFSQDGSFWYLQACNSVGYQGWGYQRMDSGEDGDLDPYIHILPASGAANGTPNRTSVSGGTGSNTDNMNSAQSWNNSPSFHCSAGWRKRGYGTGNEQYCWFSMGFIGNNDTTGYILSLNTGNPDQVANAPVITYVREAPWFWASPWTAQNSGVRTRKGTPRWMFGMLGGTANATLDNKMWICCSSTIVPFVVGPWDGVTTPSF